MWTGIIVIGVVLLSLLLARLVLSGQLGRLRHGDKPQSKLGNPGGPGGNIG